MKDGAALNQAIRRNWSNFCQKQKENWHWINGSWQWNHGVFLLMLLLKSAKLHHLIICMHKSLQELKRSQKLLTQSFMTLFNIQKHKIFTMLITDAMNLMLKSLLYWRMLNKSKKETTLFYLTEVLSIQTPEVKLTISDSWLLLDNSMKSTTLKKLESASCTILTEKLIQTLLDNKSLEKLIRKEEILSDLSILVLTSFMLLPEEFLVHTFGNTVLKRLKTMLTLISLTTNLSPKKRKCKLKTKLTKLFLKDTESANILKTKRLLKKSSVSTFIKVVSFQETQSGLSTLKELMLKHAVVLMLITHQKSDGSSSSRPQELVTVF